MRSNHDDWRAVRYRPAAQNRAHFEGESAARASGRASGRMLVDLTSRPRECHKTSLPLRRLPEFDFVTSGVHHPAELAVLGVVSLLQHLAAFGTQGGEQGG